MGKKIGILTFHIAYNYGANLQAFALKQYLSDQGYDVEIINYHNTRLERKYRKQLSPWFNVRRRDWLLPWRWKNIINSLKWYQKTKEAWQIQARRFDEFQIKYLDYNNIGVKVEEIATKGFDTIIFGSDQIWDTGITGKKEYCYWGGFESKSKKISYAASLYSAKITETEARNIKKYLPDFDCISVREEHLAQTIYALIGEKAEVVCDPTLLLPAQRYYELIKKDEEKVSEPYVLVYMVSENQRLLDVAMQYGCPVKVLHYYEFQTVFENVDEDIADAGPVQFLNLIYHASGIVTNSYHGTVFSIMFQKPFVVVFEQNERIKNLLKIVGLEKAHYSRGTSMVRADDASIEKLNRYTEQSRRFLERGIEGA